MAIKKSFLNAFEKASKTSYFEDYSKCTADFIGIARNPFSGVKVELNGLEYTIWQWCTRWYSRYELHGVAGTEAPIQTYDNMRYYLLSLNARAYMDLLD